MGDLPKGGGWTKAILLETRFGFVRPVSGIQLQFGREIFCAYEFLGQFDDPTTPSALLRDNIPDWHVPLSAPRQPCRTSAELT